MNNIITKYGLDPLLFQLLKEGKTKEEILGLLNAGMNQRVCLRDIRAFCSQNRNSEIFKLYLNMMGKS